MKKNTFMGVSEASRSNFVSYLYDLVNKWPYMLYNKFCDK